MKTIFRSLLKGKKIEIIPFLVTENETLEPERIEEITKTDNRRTGSERTFRVKYRFPIEEEIKFKREGKGIVWKRSFRNLSSGVLHFREFGMRFIGIELGRKLAGDLFFHAENPRIYNKFCLKVDAVRTVEMLGNTEYDHEGGTRWADPGTVCERIGRSPYQPFPAIALLNNQGNFCLVHGSLSQERFFHNYFLKHLNGSLQVELFTSAKDISYLEVSAGETISDEISYLGKVETINLQEVFRNYVKVLESYVGPLKGKTDINRHSAIWGSWNDGIQENIAQEELLKQADFIIKELPTVEWLQIDNGYALLSKRDETCHPHGLGMPYEGEKGIDPVKFPNGLKTFTEAVKKRGLKPAVWIGGAVPIKTPIYRDHPDWFLDYSYRFGKKFSSVVLDPSVSQVRAYIERALDFFLKKSGFSGVKLDFWSYAFEDSHDLLKNKNATGYDYRNWLLGEFNRRLPPDGYFQTGCDIVMANPFLGRYFTNYRYGIDTGAGIWEHVATNALWAVFCLATHTGHLFVPNSDSIGLFPGLNDDEALTNINFCLVSRTLVEVSGWLYKNPDHPRMAWVKKSLCCPNNGEDVYFGNFDFRKSNRPPAIWYFKGNHFSLERRKPPLPLRTVGLFNFEDKEKTISLKPEYLGLKKNGRYVLTDIWSEESFSFKREKRFRLKPHASALLAVNESGKEPSILDANLKLENVRFTGKRLSLNVLQKGIMRLILDRKPREVKSENHQLPFNISRNKENFVVEIPVEKPIGLQLIF